jgi:gluconate 2-dehydrogenase gamma chain
MPDETDDQQDASRGLSRRNLFKRAGVVGVVAATSGTTLALTTAVTAPAQTPAPATPLPREALETLTAAESDILEAIVARLIPADENGPGAAEARVAHYIDRALAGPLSASRRAYAAGLVAVDAYAQSAKGAPFATLASKDQDAVLSDMEKNVAKGFTPNSSAFFNLVRTHTIQGMFGDPYYGGNANFVGWDLIGYPGLRMVVTEDDQRMSVKPTPNRRSAYDFEMFAKKGGGHGHKSQ